MSEPSSSRFKKGQSGNPKGRPRKKTTPAPDLMTLVEQELRELTPISQNGKRVVVPYFQAHIKMLKAQAAKGCKSARRDLERLVLHPRFFREAEATPAFPEISPHVKALYNYERFLLAAFLEMGILTDSEDKPQISDWVYEAVLARRPDLRESLDAIRKEGLDHEISLWLVEPRSKSA